ncbi:MAG: SRPBCC family protein [Chthoniobacterales bacterium]|nr:SRPBCC family protein [Chthoniobacterales bacterium]
MKWFLYAIVVLAVLIGAIFIVGYSLPARTTVSRSITLHQPPAAVFAVLADVEKMAEWNRNTEKVEMLPPIKGKEATKQTFKGGMTMTIITAESAPPGHLVRAMGDDGAPFVGSWTYEISQVEEGSKVVLTEVAVFKNPLFRVMTRIFGQAKYLDEHLQDLAKKFGETAKAG